MTALAVGCALFPTAAWAQDPAATPVVVQRPTATSNSSAAHTHDAAALQHAVPGVLPARAGSDPRLAPPPPAAAAASLAPEPAPAPATQTAAPAGSPPMVSRTSASTPATVVREVESKPEKIEHNGFVTSFEMGMLGCTGEICTNAHSAQPGVKLGGFIGANIAGFVDIGLAAGWGQLRPSVEPGTNAFSLYGIDPSELESSAQAMGFDVSDLDVEDASMSALQVGPRLRLHFVPRGRVAVYAGAGFDYLRLHNSYTTRTDPVSLDFHGFAVPLHGGVEAFVAPRIALGLHFDYALSYYAAVVARDPEQTMALPMSMLESLLDGRSDPQANLPRFWSTTVGVRLTL